VGYVYLNNAYYDLRANEIPSVHPHHRHTLSLLHLTKAEKLSFASILSLIAKLYLFPCSFAYSMGIHQKPIPPKDEYIDSDDEANIAHLHVDFSPRFYEAPLFGSSQLGMCVLSS